MNLSLQDLAEIALQYNVVDGGHCVTPKYYEGVKLSYKSRIAFLEYHYPTSILVMRNSWFKPRCSRFMFFLN